jgi:hypothetical protein
MKFTLLALLSVFTVSCFAGDLPDPKLTPGAINADVTQDNIQQTICVSGWTKTIRPPASFTTKLKIKQLRSDGPYHSDFGASSFEEDHLISLELGGNPTDEKNLWPQHWSSPNGAHEKDVLENRLKRLVCTGHMALKTAQDAISTNWIAAYQAYVLDSRKRK